MYDVVLRLDLDLCAGHEVEQVKASLRAIRDLVREVEPAHREEKIVSPSELELDPMLAGSNRDRLLHELGDRTPAAARLVEVREGMAQVHGPKPAGEISSQPVVEPQLAPPVAALGRTVDERVPRRGVVVGHESIGTTTYSRPQLRSGTQRLR
jgi:hypothetical protein